MRKVVCALLIQVTLLAPALTAASEGPTLLRDAIARESARLAGESDARESQPDSNNWSVVTRLGAATPIRVTSSSGWVQGRFVAADLTRLIILNTDHQTLSEEARRALVDLDRERPDLLVQALTTNTHTRDGNLEIAPHAVFFKGQHLGGLKDFIRVFERDSVDIVATDPQRRLSISGAIGGAVGGFLLSIPISLHLAFKQCGGSCHDEGVLIAASTFGLPVVGGVLGARAFARTSSGVIYRR
jgi:hypothetical protein